MKKIIAFAGRKRSGKGILSNLIKENTDNTVIVTIANYLKLLCCDILSIDYDMLLRKKDNGDILNVKSDYRWYNIISKRTNIPYEVVETELKDKVFKNVRELLQIIGTDLIRKYNPQWHVNCMIDDINSYGDDYTIVIDDVRFPNEREAIEKMGGKVFFIIRPNYFDVSNHISETSLRWQNFDSNSIIINDLPKNTLLEYFRLAYVLGFKRNSDIPIFLSNNKYSFKHIYNSDFPRDKKDFALAKDILEQNLHNPRFKNNGIIMYTADGREKADLFEETILDTKCHTWRRDFVIYCPLINENLKFLM